MNKKIWLAVFGVAVIVGILTISLCCKGVAPVQAVIDCTAADLQPFANEIQPLVTASPDWKLIESKAEEHGATIGGCVLAQLVQQFLGGRRAVPVAESQEASEQLELFRAKVAGGATFHTTLGDL